MVRHRTFQLSPERLVHLGHGEALEALRPLILLPVVHEVGQHGFIRSQPVGINAHDALMLKCEIDDVDHVEIVGARPLAQHDVRHRFNGIAENLERLFFHCKLRFLGNGFFRRGDFFRGGRLLRRLVSLLLEPGGSVHGERANFTGLVLGCIEAKFCK